MADDVLEEAGPAPEAGKVKRDPPTIDLEATKVAETGAASQSAEAGATEAKPEGGSPQEPKSESSRPESANSDPTRAEPSRSRSASPWLVAPISGAVAAAVVIAVGSALGWPSAQTPPSAPPASEASVNDLADRVATLEARSAKTLSPAAAPTVDLSAVNDRIDQLERLTRAQAAAIAAEKTAVTKAADDLPLRRVVAAALLDVAVRHGDPFVGALASARALAPDPDKLKPLDQFAEKGVPSLPMLNRELLALVPKLSPAAAENSDSGTGIVDRLKAGASSLVRVERTDAIGNDRSAIVARATAAALRNDFGDARRELSSLDAADRAPAQAWLDKASARDAALVASRQFADDTMAALAKSAQ
jgi:hypothetical protein